MDDDRFDDLMAMLDPAMAVVTAATDAAREGCLVGFHSQVSIEPRRYGLWLSKANATFDAALQASHLGVHLLTTADHGLARLFGGTTGDEVDKFAACRHEVGPHGVLLLADSTHRFVGRKVGVLDDGGDHVLVTVEPSHVVSGRQFEPLRLSAVGDVAPGHPAGDADHPA